ncbi:DUF1513 domain-containing protein [Ramlibacter sp. AN1015]|uniref:DUF1513 domain-containing protein n=1 Tax=Ramlibacter sp. AN1015 TaxID=3133428 RepID=UPI0030C280B8
MATESPAGWSRRDCMLLAAGALLQGLPRAGAAAGPTRFAAAWNDAAAGARIGVLLREGGSLRPHRVVDVPTRAHGLLPQPGGAVLAVSRRPGDWLLRWHPDTADAQWAWAEPGRSFNGHALESADQRLLFTTETDQFTGQGLLGVRDAATLEKVDEWPTHGADPHELVRGPGGAVWVANGGILTLAETGRTKHALHRMDSSLVQLDAGDGRLRGQWRLPDARLGLRHLAWGRTAGGDSMLGIALQAEHDDPVAKAAAPVLAVFDGSALRSRAPAAPLSGYGGGVAFAAGSFVVSCPRSNGLARFDAHGRQTGWTRLATACAVDARASELWAAGQSQAQLLSRSPQAFDVDAALQLDNHWRVLG